MLIKDIYHKTPLSIPTHTTVAEALHHLIHKAFNGLLVTNERGDVVGVLSLQDIAAATIPKDMREHLNLASAMYKEGFFKEMTQKIKNYPVEKIMRTEYIKVYPDSNIMEIMADFLKNDLYIVPVYEDNKVVGIITRSEIKHALASAMEIEH